MVILRCELHVHSKASSDGISTIDEIIDAANKLKIDAIAITDHDTVDGAISALNYPDPKPIIIPGIEVSTQQGHLLVLGTTEKIEPNRDVMETIDEAKLKGAVTIVPHPFHIWRHAVGLHCPEALLISDAIEVYNSRYIMGTSNHTAYMIAQRYQKPMTTGSDSHESKFIGYGVTEINATDRSVDAILKAIQSGNTSCQGIKTPILSYTKESWENTIRKIRRRIKYNNSGKRLRFRYK